MTRRKLVLGLSIVAILFGISMLVKRFQGEEAGPRYEWGSYRRSMASPTEIGQAIVDGLNKLVH